jgi:metal-dependent amidase/aminoacylase/carboxypeptidase family protein
LCSVLETSYVRAAPRLEGILSRFSDVEFSALVATRRDLHRHPELAFEETRTAGIVSARLAGLGFSPRTGVGRTGVTADPGAADSGRILLRADMDALPLTETTGAPYESQAPGKMHACGHTGTSVDLLWQSGSRAARRPDAPIPFPAGGRRRGAQARTADACSKASAPRSAFTSGTSCPSERSASTAGAARGGGRVLDRGLRAGPGAAPHEAADPILAAPGIIDASSRSSAGDSPLDAAVVTVASVHGGRPSTSSLDRPADRHRALLHEDTGRALPESRAIVRGTAEAAGVTATLEYRRVNRATVNDRAMADMVIDTARELFGEENVDVETRTLGGEDMSVFLDRVPGCFFFVGSAPAGGHRPHHSPDFDIDERALAVGTVLFEAVALKAAQRL